MSFKKMKNENFTTQYFDCNHGLDRFGNDSNHGLDRCGNRRSHQDRINVEGNSN